jgi:hypothetical protein
MIYSSLVQHFESLTFSLLLIFAYRLSIFLSDVLVYIDLVILFCLHFLGDVSLYVAHLILEQGKLL